MAGSSKSGESSPAGSQDESLAQGNGWPEFRDAIAGDNLQRMWWLLISSTALSIALAVFNNVSTRLPEFVPWQNFDLGGSALFLGLFWLGYKGRLSSRARWLLGPAYFAFWLILMDGYYFNALARYGETATFALGAVTPAILILLPPRIVLALLIPNYLVFCALLLGSSAFIQGRSHAQVIGSWSNGSLGTLIAALAAWFLYRAYRANFRKERHVQFQEQQARNAEARLRAILENMPFQAWLKDTQSRFLAVNHEFAQAHNLSEQEILLKPTEDIYPDDRARQYRIEDEEIFRTGQGAHYEQSVKTPEGQRWYEVFKHPVLDTTGIITGVAGLARDITERKEMESRLLDADRAKSEFLAVMSHEIRTPMNSVLGYAELLEKMIEDPEQGEYLHCITESGQLLLTIINDILDLSRIEAGSLVLEHQAIGLKKLLGHIRRMFEPLAEQKHLAFRVLVDGAVPDAIMGDTSRIEQILANLISNAIKFTKDGEIEVHASVSPSNEKKPMLRIEVTDTGIGIATDQIQKLFQPFTQVDASIARRFGGTGLGLAIAQNLSRNMGGSITVTSEIGKGTTFTLTLPVVIPSAASRAALSEQEAEKEADLRGRSILVVEDNLSNRRLVATILTRWGMEVSLARTGQEALDALARRGFDAILMDVQMPDMDGFETTRLIRKWEASHPERAKSYIIAFTALAMSGDEARCREAGMDNYVVKPLNLPLLNQVLARAMQP